MVTTIRNYWKQFEAWATGSQHNIFYSARLKLTFFYSTAITIVIGILSLALYITLAEELRAQIHHRPINEAEGMDLIGHTIDGLQARILFLDIFMLSSTGIISYFLAGKTLQPVEATLTSQKQFTADASHELRTPLAIMKIETEVALKNKFLSLDEAKKILASNLEEVNNLSTMVIQLLQICRQENISSARLQTINFSQLAEKTVKKMKSLAVKKDISLTAKIMNGVMVHGDALALEHMIINLLSNALTYTPPQGNVLLKLTIENGIVSLKISDTGIGISKNDLPHIFERFYKADKTRESGKGGAGLGLAIVKEIVSRHAGTITVDSSILEGTNVTVHLTQTHI